MTYQKTNDTQQQDIGGFVAGTLVHTDKGLVPIEQIKVGDRVLSKPENGEGKQAYKRITKTFKSQEKLPIVRVRFGKEMGSDSAIHLFCTANHPLWSAERQQWLLAIDFKSYQQLIDLQGQAIDIRDDVGYVMASSKATIGLCHSSYAYYDRGSDFIMVDFGGNKIRFVGGDAPLWTGVSHRSWWHPDEETVILPHYDNKKDFPKYSLARFYMRVFRESNRPALIHPQDPNPNLETAFKAYVYNIEVKDFHTYYVGKSGIWGQAIHAS